MKTNKKHAISTILRKKKKKKSLVSELKSKDRWRADCVLRVCREIKMHNKFKVLCLP